MFIGVHGRRREPQALRAAWHGRIVDWLHIDSVPFEQQVARLLAKRRITDGDGHDMADRWHDWQTGGAETPLERRGPLLMAHAKLPVSADIADAGECCRGDGGRH